MADQWEDMSPRERADLIRGHRSLSDEAICRLFELSTAGLRAIMAGADWRPEYTAAAGDPNG